MGGLIRGPHPKRPPRRRVRRSLHSLGRRNREGLCQWPGRRRWNQFARPRHFSGVDAGEESPGLRRGYGQRHHRLAAGAITLGPIRQPLLRRMSWGAVAPRNLCDPSARTQARSRILSVADPHADDPRLYGRRNRANGGRQHFRCLL